MKTEISRNSHDPEKRYSGVYQQQGRMITDADWNELVDIVKARLNDALTDAIGSGVPENGGIIKDGELHWGVAYADGVRAELSPAEGDASVAFSFDGQADFPLLPGSKPESEDIVFLDVWERVVTSYEDAGLMDSALHGADTCSRTKTMVQVKWCSSEQELQNVIDATKATLSVVRSDRYAAKDTNFVFRVEVHSIGKAGLVLKWSRENAAEQFYRLDAENVGQTPPDYFKQGNRVFEYFKEDSEKYFGFTGSVSIPINRNTMLKQESAPAPAAAEYPHVRRWDGYCEVAISDPVPSVIHDSLTGEKVSLDGNVLTLALEDFTLTVETDGWETGRLLAGDYWQFAVRPGDDSFPEKVSPAGIRHRYLLLGTYMESNQISVSDNLQGEFSFPSLSQAHDTFVNVTGDTMSGSLIINNKLTVSDKLGVGFPEGAVAAKLAVNGGLHVGGNSNPGDNNLQVDGSAMVGGNVQVGANVIVGGAVTVTGDLTVNGNTTTVNTSQVEVEDNILRVNKYAPRPVPLNKNGGLEVFRGGTANNAQILWNESLKRWMAGVEGSMQELVSGPEWNTLTSGADATSLHRHSKLVPPDGSPDPAVAVHNGGRVGIGTGEDALSERLEVLGNVKISGRIIQGDWIPVPLMSEGWTRYNSEYNPPEFYMDTCGFVHLRGMIKGGATGSGSVIFTLPAGFRPENRELFCVMSAGSAGRCDVDRAGRVVACQGDPAWYSLDGIVFRAKVLTKLQWNNAINQARIAVTTTANDVTNKANQVTTIQGVLSVKQNQLRLAQQNAVATPALITVGPMKMSNPAKTNANLAVNAAQVDVNRSSSQLSQAQAALTQAQAAKVAAPVELQIIEAAAAMAF